MLAKIILLVMRWLNRQHLKLIKNHHCAYSNNFEGLTPYIEKNAEKHFSDPYTEALDKALGNHDIKNIAITGSFGAGKSSFLHSFERHHKGWSFLFISLATFKDKSGDENNQLIEKSILQQLIHKVERSVIPLSTFNKIQKFQKKQAVIPIATLLGWILATSMIFKLDATKNIPFLGELSLIPTTIIFIVTSVILSFKAYEHLSNYRVTKVSSNGTIDVSEDSKESILNKHIDEILYFFSVTEYNVVVIEDLDRSNNQEIFIKLREINELINKSDQVKGVVNFIYAIKDEMFQDETRTKFFDYMIPIIPYITRSNSYGKLKERLTSYCKDSSFNNLLKDVSQYIYDMRLLKNIVNEFKIYDGKIKEEVDRTKLFAMIVYKNMYPSDFSKLHKNEGVLASVFNNKSEYLQKAVSHLDSQIEKVDKEIKAQRERTDWHEDLKELRSIYLLKFIQHYNINDGARLKTQDGKTVNLDETIETEESFNNLRIVKNITNQNITRQNQYNQNPWTQITIDFPNIEALVNKKLSYDDRRNIIEGKIDEKIQELKQKAEKLTKEKLQLAGNKIDELLSIDIVNQYFIDKTQNSEAPTKQEKKDDNGRLLRFLIRNGYIDEYFHTTISHFHEGSISEQDHTFLLTIRDQNSLPFNYSLHTPKELIKELHWRDFEYDSILNFNLIDELIENPEPKKLQSLVKLLSTEGHKVNQFVEEYFSVANDREKFINLLVENRALFWVFIQNNDNFSDRKKGEYLAVIITSSKTGDVVSLNKNDLLKKYIENKYDFIEFIQGNNAQAIQDKAQDLLDQLNVKFKILDSLQVDSELSQYIYNNEHYQLNPEMIKIVVEVFGESKLTPEIKNKLKASHLTTIKELNLEPLLQYINNDIESYIEESLLSLENNSQESEETVIDLLNNYDIDIDVCKEIILKQDVKISDLKLLKQESLWKFILINDRLAPSWDNAMYYYKSTNEEMDNSLSSYLNNEKNYKILQESKINSGEKFDKEFDQRFSRKLLLSNKISDEAYVFLVNSIYWEYPDLNVSQLPENKIGILLDAHKIRFSVKNFEYLIDSGTNKYTSLIEADIDTFFEKKNELELPKGTTTLLLKSTSLNTEEKEKVIQNIYNESNYDLLDSEDGLVDAIYDVCIHNSAELNFSFIEVLFQHQDNKIQKIRLLIKYARNLEGEEISSLLTTLGEPYSKIRQKGIFAYLLKSDLNKELANTLESTGYILKQSYTLRKIKLTLRRK